MSRQDDDDEDDDRENRPRKQRRPARSRRDDEYDDDDYDDDDRESRRRNKRKAARGSGVACPNCGSQSNHDGPWPWYLGTVGAIMCKAVICNDCDHEFDTKKPNADLATRKRNLAIGINGCGLLGIIAVIGLLVLWISLVMH